MSKRKPDNEDDDQETDDDEQHHSICRLCHMPKIPALGSVDGGEPEMLPHKFKCKKKCMNVSCDHRSHKKKKKKQPKKKLKTSLTQYERAGYVAGFKVKLHDMDTKEEWDKQLKEHGLDSSSPPGPQQVDSIVKAARDYAHKVATKHVASTSMSAPSANAVINIFEHASRTTPPTSTSASTATSISTSTSTPTSINISPFKYQCNNCNYISDMSSKDVSCMVCGRGTMLSARADARFSPEVFQVAIAMIRSEQQTQAKKETDATTTATHNTNTTSTSASMSTSTSTSTSSSSGSLKHGSDWLRIDVSDLDDDIESFSDDDVILPTKKLVTQGTQTSPKGKVTVGTQTNYNMVFKELTNTVGCVSSALGDLKISSVFPIKKHSSSQAKASSSAPSKENIPQA